MVKQPRMICFWEELAALRRWGVVLLALLLAFPGLIWAVDNGGLGPLSIRNLFPPALGFLSYTPGSPVPVPLGKLRLGYQYSLANTFINTQSPAREDTPEISSVEVDRGLTTEDFSSDGYAAYIDVETERHQFRLRFGLAESVEFELEQAWVSFYGGGLDGQIESVEKSVNGYNEDRKYSDQNRFEYYLLRNGETIFATAQRFEYVPQDPVMHLKWNWGEGGDVLPTVALKVSYKSPLDSAKSEPRKFLSSGRADYGYYLMLGKAVGMVVGHYQFGITHLNHSGDNFASNQEHKTFAFEFRTTEQTSWLLQASTQTSVFKAASYLSNRQDFQISRATDVLTIGHKQDTGAFQLEWGFVEDFTQNLNETDIVLFLEVGAQW